MGFLKDYKKVLEILKSVHPILFGIGYGLSDLPFFGYSPDEFERERAVFNSVDSKYKDFIDALLQATGETKNG